MENIQHVAGASLLAQLFLNPLWFLQAWPMSLLQNKNGVKLWEILAVQEVNFHGDGSRH